MSVQDRQGSSRFQLRLMWSRMGKATRLDREGILELKAGKDATGQSIAVLVFAALSYGIGFTLLTEFRQNDISLYGIIVGSLATTVTVCFAAFVWSAALFLVGTKLFQGKTGYWELARPLFFSTSPFLLFILISIPIYIIQVTVTLVAVAWLIVSQTFTLKQVMGFGIRRTVLTIMVAFLILIVLNRIFPVS